jgi:hypothetical protein
MTDQDEAFRFEAIERPVRFAEQSTSAAAVLRDGLRQAHLARQQEVDSLLIEIGLCAFQVQQTAGELDRAAAGHVSSVQDGLTIICANLQDVLDRYQVRLEDLTHQAWTPERRQEVDIRGRSINSSIDQPRVVHMERPIVRRGERLLCKGAAILETPARD